MKILVVGGGGREHALCWKLAQSKRVTKIYCAPGNPGIAGVDLAQGGRVECVNVAIEDIDGLARLVHRERIDLTVVGPEAPLCAGIVDRWELESWQIFGPNKRGAELEGSKVFTKSLLRKHGIPTADFQTFTDYEKAEQYCLNFGGPLVVKADGLAAGKGVIMAKNGEEAAAAAKGMLNDKSFGSAGQKIVIEEVLKGEEASIIFFTDGQTLALLPSSQDHKRIGDGDTGPNTGGMGAYSPAPLITEALESRIIREILVPTLHALRREDRPYKGVLYAGIMVTDSGPKILEYNCRFGDPECEVLLPRLESDLVDIIEKVLQGKLEEDGLKISDTPSACVVMASEGYPGNYKKGTEIKGLAENGQVPDAPGIVFHAGTQRNKDGMWQTNGGRVLAISATGSTIKAAVDNAYATVDRITFAGSQHRKDIAWRALKA
jgi:phosphoribosylamine--glycine ligase